MIIFRAVKGYASMRQSFVHANCDRRQNLPSFIFLLKKLPCLYAIEFCNQRVSWSKLTRANTKRTFRSIKAQFMLPQHFEDISEVPQMLGNHLALHNHIINVNLDILTQLGLKHSSHHPLVSKPRILQSKRDHLIMIIPSGCDKSSILLVGHS